VAAALCVGLVTVQPRTARADTVGPAIAFAVVCALAVWDVTVFGYDTKTVAEGHLPSKGWAIAEAAVGVPQAVLGNALYIAVGRDAEPSEPANVALLLLPIGLTSMATHGVWGAATTNVRPAALYGYSPLIGTNVALTAAAVGEAARGRLHGLPVGIAQTVLTAPQVVLGAVQIAHDPANRGIWIGETAWTTALLAHGIASIVAAAQEEREQREQPPAPPSPPRPRNDDDEDDGPPLHVPSSFHVTPGVVTDGVARAPAVVVTGRF
jgi:hypothetical protein